MDGLKTEGATINAPFYFEPPVSLGDVAVSGGVRILKHSYMNSGRICSAVYIGRYCSIGYNVTIGVGHHNLDLISTSSWFDSKIKTIKKVNPEVLVKIKNDVWIGNNVIIMNGVTIGNGAVIGAGAVVTKDVPDYAIVAGVPAKILRMRFSQDIITRLTKLKWWELDDVLLKDAPLADIAETLEYLEGLPPPARNSINENIRILK